MLLQSVRQRLRTEPRGLTHTTCRLCRDDPKLHPFCMTKHTEPAGNSDNVFGQKFVQGVDAADWLASKLNDYIPIAQTGNFTRAIWFHLQNEQAGFDWQIEMSDQTPMNFGR